MKLFCQRVLLVSLGIVLLLGATVATATEIPLRNWPAPATWSPSSSAGARTALADVSGPLPFVPADPCRVVDTRAGSGFAGQYGPPALVAQATRSFTISGQCGIPTGAQAVSFQFTAVNMTSSGNFRAWPQGALMPTASILNWNATQGVAGNGIVVPIGGSGGLSIFLNAAVSNTVDLVLDINGYYIGNGNPLNAGERFWVSGSFSLGGMIKGTNNFNGSSGWGGFFETFSTTDGAIGSYGLAYGPGALIGVRGETRSATDGTVGVWGNATSASGKTIGVLGSNSSTVGQSYGVVGLAGDVTWVSPNSYQAGGRFAASAANSYGVVSEGEYGGLIGMRVDSGGVWQNYGFVGYQGTDGLYTPQHLTAIGGKSFAEPLPGDPSRVIKYVCPEGPESGTYFRGRGRFEGHTAVIEVPEHFRIVTAEEGLTVQITPIGRAAAVGVTQIGLDRIVVEATQDVEFSYLVQGVRKAYKEWQPVQAATPKENPYFIPASADQKMESFWPEEIRQRLISNGTYHADGTVNLQTAERMGWAQKWRDDEKARTQAAARLRAVSEPQAGVDGSRR